MELVGTGLKIASMMLSVVRSDSGLGLCARDRGELGRDPPGVRFSRPNAGLVDAWREKDGRGREPKGLFSRSVATPAMTSPFLRGGDL